MKLLISHDSVTHPDSAVANNSSPPSVRAEGTSAGAIAGGVIGSVLLAGIIVALLLTMCSRRRKRPASEDSPTRVEPYDYDQSKRSTVASMSSIPTALQSVKPLLSEDTTSRQMIPQQVINEIAENQPRDLQEIRVIFAPASVMHAASLDAPPQYSNSIATLA